MMTHLQLAALMIGAAAGLAGLDRLLLWFEKRGWMYWRRSQGRRASVGNALLELQSVLEPEKRHVLEVRRQASPDEDESGDKPEPGT